MKTAIIFAALLTVAGCTSSPPPPPSGLLVQAEFYVPSAAEELYGTWVNPALRPPTFYPKLTIGNWGVDEYFGSVDDDVYDWRDASIIVSKWKDDTGDTWYRQFSRCSLKGFYAGHVFTLIRVSEGGAVLESIYGNLGWPAPQDLDPETNPTYVKYHRLQP